MCHTCKWYVHTVHLHGCVVAHTQFVASPTHPPLCLPPGTGASMTTHSPAMHSPHLTIRTKGEPPSSFNPVSTPAAAGDPNGGAGPGGDRVNHVPTPPRPVSTHTPGMQQHPAPVQVTLPCLPPPASSLLSNAMQGTAIQHSHCPGSSMVWEGVRDARRGFCLGVGF